MTEATLRERLRLMVLTDPGAPLGMVEAVRAALAGGATAVQLRWKAGGGREMVEVGRVLRQLTRTSGALFLVNDRIDVAVVVEADGAHLGDDDVPIEIARQITPPGFVLGHSVDDAEEAAAAASKGADYLGLGPIFPTHNKAGLGAAIGPEGVAAVRRRVELPFVGIGGIGPGGAAAIANAGADGIAVIGAVMFDPDPEGAARGLLAEFEQGRAQPG